MVFPTVAPLMASLKYLTAIKIVEVAINDMPTLLLTKLNPPVNWF